MPGTIPGFRDIAVNKTNDYLVLPVCPHESLTLSLFYCFQLYLDAVLQMCAVLANLFFFLNLVLAASGLSCGTQDLLLWHAGFSLVVVHGLQSAWAL